jgi:RNA polymerase sigma-70 factor (ECF subfamily)
MSGVAPAGGRPRRAASTLDEKAREVDALLVRRCRAGDAAAWPEIVERFSSYVYAITLGFGLRSDQVEDVFQDVFTRAFARLDSLRDDYALKPWIAQLTRHAAVDRIRADRRELPTLDDGEVSDFDPGLERIELAMTVARALDELPAPFGEALRRFFLEDESYRTIGEALGVPPGTVASRISRGLALLRELLTDEGLVANDQV